MASPTGPEMVVPFLMVKCQSKSSTLGVQTNPNWLHSGVQHLCLVISYFLTYTNWPIDRDKVYSHYAHIKGRVYLPIPYRSLNTYLPILYWSLNAYLPILYWQNSWPCLKLNLPRCRFAAPATPRACNATRPVRVHHSLRSHLLYWNSHIDHHFYWNMRSDQSEGLFQGLSLNRNSIGK